MGKIDIFKVSKLWSLNEHRSRNSKNPHVFWTSILSRFGMGLGMVSEPPKPQFSKFFRGKIDHKNDWCLGRFQEALKNMKKAVTRGLDTVGPRPGRQNFGSSCLLGEYVGFNQSTKKQMLVILTRPWAKGPANFFWSLHSSKTPNFERTFPPRG